MSHTNTNVRSLRDKFQQQQANQYDNMTKNRQEQNHDILFQCIHCGKHQTVTVVLQSTITRVLRTGASSNMNQCPCPQNLFTLLYTLKIKKIVEPPSRAYDAVYQSRNTEQENKSSASSRAYDAVYSSKNTEQENKPSAPFRQVSMISEEQDDLTPPLHRSNYALDFRNSNDENISRKSIEQNIKGFVDTCVRSSLHDISHGNRETDTQNIVEVEIEYDPILGNVKSTRKRSSTITTNLDNDHRPSNHRHQSVNTRYKILPSESDRDTSPIWARRRISHSIVKPSDLIRESDKKEKLDPNAFRRLSRTDLTDDSVTPKSTIKSTISPQNPSMIKDTILRWCQDLTQFYKGVNIRNFSSSWNDGLAFCAIIHRYFPDEFNFDTLNANEHRQNFDLAFTVALDRAGVEPLIDTDDMILMGEKPDWKVVFTYVQSLYRHLSRTQPPAIMRERW